MFVRIEAEGYTVLQLHIGIEILSVYAGYFMKRKLSNKNILRMFYESADLQFPDKLGKEVQGHSAGTANVFSQGDKAVIS